MICDRCDHDAAWLVFAAYFVPFAIPYPNRVVALYPAPMARACAAHLADVLGDDLRAPTPSTGQWVVRPAEAPT